jgi:hypothetical protein
MAAWEQLKEMAGEMRDAFVEAVKDFIKMKIIEQAIQWLVSLFIPGAGIIKAIIGIYDTVVFFIKKAKQIMQMISNFLGSISEIAAGNIGAAAEAMEKGLARGLSLVISFLAQLLRLSGITNKIRDAIQKIRGKVDAVLLKVAKWIAEKAKKLFGAVFGKGKAKEADKPKSVEEAKWDAAVAAVHADLEKMEQQGVTDKDLDAALPGWRKQHGFKTLTVQATDDDYIIEGSMSPGKNVGKVHKSGSKKNPFKLEWPKRASAEYPILYFGGKTGGAVKSQSVLKGLFTKKAKDVEGVQVREYDPHTGGPLYESDGKGGEKKSGDKIGISSKYRISVGKVIGPLSTAQTPKGGKINSVLKKHGFSPSTEGMDGDHVTEVQFGGDDVIENLWPLDSGENLSAGPTLAGASVQYPTSGKTIKISELKQKSTKYYFKIIKTK